MVSNVRVVLHKKMRGNGEYPIMLRLTHNGKTKFISVGVTILPAQWDKKKEEPKKSHPLYQELLIKIQSAKLSASRAVLSNEVVDTRQVLEEAVHKVVSTMGVIAYCKATIERLRAENRHGYANAFWSMQLSLEKTRVCNQKDYQFTDMTPQFVRKWESAMRTAGNEAGTISIYLRTFRVLMGYARLEKLTKINPFFGEDKFSMTGYHYVQTPKRALSKEAIATFRSYGAELNSAEFHAQQLFMFSYYTKGTNFRDIANLVPGDRKGDYLNYKRAKTHVWQKVYLLAPAKEIWDYYVATMKPGQETVFWFILNPIHKDGKQKQYRFQRVLKQVNKELRAIATTCKIEEYLTTYVARHSFASNLKHLGIPTDQISELLGHDSVRTTKIYLEQFEDAVLNKAVEQLL